MSEKNNEIIELGTISLSDRIVVSDPCYSRDVACMKDNVYIKQGKYFSYAVKSGQGEFGNRIACITCIHEQNLERFKKSLTNNWWTLDDNIGVNSGQVGIFDNSIYPEFYNSIYLDECEQSALVNRDAFYKECRKITLSIQQCGILKNKKGIVSSSCYDVGFYKLKILKEDDVVIALMLQPTHFVQK